MKTHSYRRLRRLAALLSWSSAALTLQLFTKPKSPTRALDALPKIAAGALAPLVAMGGTLGAALAALIDAPVSAGVGALSALLSVRYVRRVTASHDAFARAFGDDWHRRLPPSLERRMLPRRWMGVRPLPPAARRERDRVYWTLDAGHHRRPLRCDLWLPRPIVPPSGLAVLYVHGGGWRFLDKDVGTRPFFRYLAAQGHVVMDIAYRTWPETNVRGMVGDVKRAVAWMKAHGGPYGVRPDRIVLAGASAGGHLALLSAYTAGQTAFTPPDLGELDTSVRGVVSYYGAVELAATQRYVAVHDLRYLLGGKPEALPDAYAQASPLTHVGPHCPPTLLFQGEHDWYMPLSATRVFARRLKDHGVPTVYVEFPQTDHAFDLVLPRFSPSSQAALYDLERFLGVLM